MENTPQLSNLLPAGMAFNQESLADSMRRYLGFGKEIFFELEKRFPGITEKFQFFQPQHSQEEDVWAICKNGTQSFGVQLDPYCEVIVLWNENQSNHIEIGTWWENEYEAAIAYIEEVFFGMKPSGEFHFE